MFRVVVTGIGVVSPLGQWSEFKTGVRDGLSGVKRLPDLTALGLKSQIAGEVDSSLLNRNNFSKKTQRNLSRVAELALNAAREAFFNAGLDPASFSYQDSMDTAVYVGSGGGGIDIIEREYSIFYGNNGRKVSPFSIPAALVGMTASEVSIGFGLTGTSQAISTGCTSSTDTLGTASWMIKTGAIKRALAGGADACITPGIITGFERMGVISRGFNDNPQRASRPFNADRDGFVLGEGAWFFVLERFEDAKKRRATVYAEILGYGSNCEAGHRVRMNEDGVWSAKAIKSALESSKINSSDVSYVSMHGTSTQLNDLVETRALKLVFGEKKVPGSSPKSMMGHPQGACGAMGLAATIAGMEDRFLPPTINYEIPDKECDWDYVPNVAREQEINVAVCNCIGFGSRNSALVIKRCPELS